MEEKSIERRVFWNRADIPPGTKALIINVKDPFLTLVAEELDFGQSKSRTQIDTD